jgi:hypothetical protein
MHGITQWTNYQSDSSNRWLDTFAPIWNSMSFYHRWVIYYQSTDDTLFKCLCQVFSLTFHSNHLYRCAKFSATIYFLPLTHKDMYVHRCYQLVLLDYGRRYIYISINCSYQNVLLYVKIISFRNLPIALVTQTLYSVALENQIWLLILKFKKKMRPRLDKGPMM